MLWLWRRPAAMTAIQPLAWEPPYATGAAQEMEKKDQKRRVKYTGVPVMMQQK